MSRFSETFIKSLESDFYIETRETRTPTEDELRQLKEKDDGIHRLQEELAQLQERIRLKRREADAFVNQIYGVKTVKVKKRK